MAYKQKSGLHFKGLFDNLKRVVTAKKVIKQDLENKSNPFIEGTIDTDVRVCLLFTSPSPRDRTRSRMPSSA